MKIILLGDLHLGARNASTRFSQYFNQFFTDVLFPYMENNSIKHIFQLGDLFDNRTGLSLKAFYNSKSVWFDELVKRDFEMTVLLGNHDIHYRHSLKINSPDLVLKEYKSHINIIDRPTAITLGTYAKIDIIPWLCDENKAEIQKFINRDGAGNILLGHLELSGFPMYRGDQVRGDIPKDFDRYELVFTGHYHTRSEKGNIIYTGTPYEITWADYGDPKGFYVFDTETKAYEFVVNPNKMFYKLNYSNGCKQDISELKSKNVRVIVKEKRDAVQFERWIDSIKLISPYDLSIVENNQDTSPGEIDENISLEDTQGIINSYISGIETTVDKDSLKQFLSVLYTEAMMTDD